MEPSERENLGRLVILGDETDSGSSAEADEGELDVREAVIDGAGELARIRAADDYDWSDTIFSVLIIRAAIGPRSTVQSQATLAEALRTTDCQSCGAHSLDIRSSTRSRTLSIVADHTLFSWPESSSVARSFSSNSTSLLRTRRRSDILTKFAESTKTMWNSGSG